MQQGFYENKFQENRGILQMAKKTDIIKTAKKFCRELKRRHIIDIKAVYLFGSIAKKKQNIYSDMDLAIVSDSFSGFKFRDRGKINPIILKTDTNIEVHPFSTKEFIDPTPFVKEILQTGIKIA